MLTSLRQDSAPKPALSLTDAGLGTLAEPISAEKRTSHTAMRLGIKQRRLSVFPSTSRRSKRTEFSSIITIQLPVSLDSVHRPFRSFRQRNVQLRT